MSRIDFFKKMIRYMLLFLLAAIAALLVRRVDSVSNCSSCPGNGLCKGESDCSKFLAV